MKLQGAVAMVTGASSGIGRATALALARKGARVVLAARNVPALEALAVEIEQLGQAALVCQTDVTRPEEIRMLIGKVLSDWGRIDVLVTSSGQYIRSPIRELTLPLAEQSMRVNFYGAISVALGVLPEMLAQRNGHIVLVSSMDARLALPFDAPYTVAKAALLGFGDTLRKELYGSGVSVTSVLPGRVDTPMIAGMMFHPLSAKISPRAVAQAILRAIERRQPVVVLPPQAGLLSLVSTLSPTLADWIIRLLWLEGREEKPSGRNDKNGI